MDVVVLIQPTPFLSGLLKRYFPQQLLLLLAHLPIPLVDLLFFKLMLCGVPFLLTRTQV